MLIVTYNDTQHVLPQKIKCDNIDYSDDKYLICKNQYAIRYQTEDDRENGSYGYLYSSCFEEAIELAIDIAKDENIVVVDLIQEPIIYSKGEHYD